MFIGTKFYYKILYFLTAMAPSYVLFTVQVFFNFSNNSNKIIRDGNFEVSIIGVITTTILLTLLLKKLLHKQIGQTDSVVGSEIEKYKDSEIEEINGEVISFLLGNILPTVIMIENSLTYTLVIFIFIQILLFILIIKSTDSFPNVLLIIFGVDLKKNKEGDFIFAFKVKKQKKFKVYELGDNMFIAEYKKKKR